MCHYFLFYQTKERGISMYQVNRRKKRRVRLNKVRFTSFILFIIAIFAVIKGMIFLNQVKVLYAEASSYIDEASVLYQENEKMQHDLSELQNSLIQEYEDLLALKEDIGDNLYLLAKIIHLEERTQNPKNIDRKVAVGRVVLNRVKHPDFPDTIEEVIFQENQFSPTFDGSWDEYEPTELDFEAALLALKEVQIVGEKGKDIGEALFFVNPKHASKRGYQFFKKLEYIDKVGEHEFYTLKDGKN